MNARFLEATGAHERALSAYEHSMALRPGLFAKPWGVSGYYSLRLDTDGAKGAFMRDIQMRRVALFLVLNRLAEAELAYCEAERLVPHYSFESANNALSRLFLIRQQPEAALEYAKKATRNANTKLDLAEAFYNKACALISLQRESAGAKNCLLTAIMLHAPYRARAQASPALSEMLDEIE